MSHTRIKICGITRVEDALLAAELGADAIGLVFYPQSPRCLTSHKAQEIVKVLPAFVTTVGLFVDQTAEEISKILAEVNPNLLQFHGAESQAWCSNFGVPYIKALRMQSGVNVKTQFQGYSDAKAILLDTYHVQHPGGTGVTFDWNLIPQKIDKPLILAGGLNAANVAGAIHRVRPYAVDVSSGVESAPGIKDVAKLKAFFHEVRHADYDNSRGQF